MHRRGKGEEPVAQCILVDDTYEIELLDDGRSHLWGCIHLPPHEPGGPDTRQLRWHFKLESDMLAGPKLNPQNSRWYMCTERSVWQVKRDSRCARGGH